MNEITKEVIIKTEKTLKQLGFKITRKAFEYWSLAVIIKIRQQDVTMEQIYSLIAQKYNVSANCVSKRIWLFVDNADNQRLQKYFEIEEKITPSIFLTCLAKDVKRQIEAERK